MNCNDKNDNGGGSIGRRRNKKRKGNANPWDPNSANANAPSPSRENTYRRNNNSIYNNDSSASIINAPSTTPQAYLNWFLQQTGETTLHNAIDRIIHFGAGISSWSNLDEIEVCRDDTSRETSFKEG